MSKWSPNERIILTKDQLGQLYTFWTMATLIFSPFANVGKHPLLSNFSWKLGVVDIENPLQNWFQPIDRYEKTRLKIVRPNKKELKLLWNHLVSLYEWVTRRYRYLRGFFTLVKISKRKWCQITLFWALSLEEWFGTFLFWDSSPSEKHT